jgi:hypothetical protein
MLRFRDEEELAKYGLKLDPHDLSKAVRLADGQQGATSAENLPGDAVPAGSGPNAKTEKAQAAPFDLAARLDRVVGLQGRALKHDRFRTLLYCRSGLELIEIKKAFKELGRRDFCVATKFHGIQPWFRKRAMQIARYFRTEEACKGIPLLEALKLSRKQPGGKRRPKGTAISKTRVGHKAEIPEEADQEDQFEEGEVTADEVQQEEADKELEEKLREEWLDRLWMLFEQVATNGLEITEEERTALAAFTERFTDNDRALLVLFFGAWQLARQQQPPTTES